MPYPSIKQLQCLVALDEHRHFGRAAQSCCMSASAFSIAIRNLEQRLGVSLVERTNRQLVFTEAGRAVADRARICLGHVEALVDLARESEASLSGRLTLGVIPTIAPFLLPRLMPVLRQAFPSLKLYLREEKTRVLHEQLLGGHLDLLMLALPFDLPRTESMALFDDPFLLATAPNSRWLEGVSTPVDPARLPSESILLLDDGHCLRDHALQACALRESDQVSRFAATSLPTLLHMVAEDLGVTFIPAMASDSLMVPGGCLEVHGLASPAGRRIGLAWRKGSVRRGDFLDLAGFLKSSLAGKAPPGGAGLRRQAG